MEKYSEEQMRSLLDMIKDKGPEEFNRWKDRYYVPMFEKYVKAVREKEGYNDQKRIAFEKFEQKYLATTDMVISQFSTILKIDKYNKAESKLYEEYLEVREDPRMPITIKILIDELHKCR